MADAHNEPVPILDAGWVKVLRWPRLSNHLVAIVSEDKVTIGRLDTGQHLTMDRTQSTDPDPGSLTSTEESRS